MISFESKPSRALYDAVRAAFTKRSESLNAWCKTHRVPRHRAVNALLGLSTGPDADRLRERLMVAAGLNDELRASA